MSVGRFEVDELAAIAPAWDAAVEATPDVDGFCASTAWSFSAATSFPDADEPVVVGDGVAFCGMRSARSEAGPVLVGLDPVWGFATPFVGPPMRAAQMLSLRLRSDDTWRLAVVAGQREDSPLTACLAQLAEGEWTLYRGTTEARLRIDLADGVDAWFARRSSRFRQRLRRLERDADGRGLTVHDVSAVPPDELFDRVVAIEARSWKGREGTGLASPDLQVFYRQVFTRLGGRDHLRVLVARLDGRDVGYIAGGVRGDLYRGLQLAHDADHAELGVGHLLQLAQLRLLEAEGVATYDLGMDMAYKHRWADRVDETISVVISRSP